MADDSKPWKIKSSRIPYQNNWMRIREDTVVTPTGKDGIYAVLESNDSVKIVAANSAGKLYLIHKYRYTDQSWTWELPGGGGDGQEPLAAAQRELQEEGGLTSNQWHHLGQLTVCDGFMTEKEDTFLAVDVQQTQQTEDSDEIIKEAGFFSLDEVYDMIDNGHLNSGESLASLTLYTRWLSKKEVD